VRFGCEGLVVFWGGCVVFWCSFWVGFWLSESLRGVFTPARNGRRQGSPCLQGEPQGADKGTTAWHGISAAGAVFPSACVNGQARCIALTPFVPLSRLAGEGERAAGRTAARSHTPLPQRGRGAGGEGKKCAPPAHSEPKRCTLIRPQGGGYQLLFFVNFGFAIGISSGRFRSASSMQPSPLASPVRHSEARAPFRL
jgi:hypothetical protein